MRCFGTTFIAPHALFAAFLAVGAGLLAPAKAAPEPSPAIAVAKVEGCPARFVTCMAGDGLSGGLWVGTEDQGLFYWEGDGKPWRQFTEKDGVGNDIYAVAVDKAGRCWAGTLNGGIAVYNGSTWKRYHIEEGIPGERVFSIASNPANGDVWIATSGGLARWLAVSDTWKIYTRLDGLPSEQVQSIAIDKDGIVYTGTQCDGIAIASPVDNYARWECISAPEGFGPDKRWPLPLTGKGTGLPSNLINQMFAGKDGTIWAATTAGLAWSRNKGGSWMFLRGRNYADKVKGFYVPPKTTPPSFTQPTTKETASLLPEDYATCIGEDADERLVVGFREAGLSIISIKDWRACFSLDGKKADFVTCFVSSPSGVFFGCYGSGVSLMAAPATTKPSVGLETKTLAELPFPSSMPPPTDAEIAAAIKRLSALKEPVRPGFAMYLGEDWATQGDWCERYGRRDAMLCAKNAPIDNETVNFDFAYRTVGVIGPHKTKDDALRHWVHWIKANNNRRVLYSPVTAIRTEAEWDDHGETYPRAFEGPDVWAVVKVPAGTNAISLYFYNPNGHDGTARFRDYMIEIRRYDSTLPEDIVLAKQVPEKFNLKWDCRTKDIENVLRQPVLAKARVRDFCGGVYKTFAVQGSGTFYVRVSRNWSFNTILNGVFSDKLVEPALQLSNANKRSGMRNTQGDTVSAADTPQTICFPIEYGYVSYAPPAIPQMLPGRLAMPSQLWAASNQACSSKAGIMASRLMRQAAYRAAVARHGDALTANWRWELRRWSEDEHKLFWQTMMLAWNSLQDKNPCLRSKEFRPYSPNVVPLSVEKLEEMARQNIDWRNCKQK